MICSFAGVTLNRQASDRDEWWRFLSCNGLWEDDDDDDGDDDDDDDDESQASCKIDKNVRIGVECVSGHWWKKYFQINSKEIVLPALKSYFYGFYTACVSLSQCFLT